MVFAAMQFDEQRTRNCSNRGTGSELRIPNAAAQTRIVSKARIRLDSRKSVRSFKGIICVDISEIAVDTVITVNGSF